MATDMRAHDEIQFDYFCIFRAVSFLENKKKEKTNVHAPIEKIGSLID